MTALSTGRLTPQMVGSSGPMPAKLCLPVKASTYIYAGSLVALQAGYARPGTAALGLFCVGKAEADADNSTGSNGDVNVTVLTGAFRFENSASSDLIAQANVGQLAYLVDDQTVALTSGGGTRSAAGIILGVDSSGVWVLMGLDATAALAAAQTSELTYLKIAADAAASTATAETAFARLTAAGTIVGAYYSPSAALTASDTDYATLTLKIRDGEGGAAATVATLVTNVAGGSWVAFTPKSLGTLTNAAGAANSVLTLTITKAGSGVAVPAGVLTVIYAPA